MFFQSTDILPYIQMATSLVSFVKAVMESQQDQGKKIGQVRQTGFYFTIFYILFALGESASKIFLFSLVQGPLPIIFWPLALIPLSVANHCMYRALDMDKRELTNLILSCFIPLNFIGQSEVKTRNFVKWYKLTHLTFLVLATMVWVCMAIFLETDSGVLEPHKIACLAIPAWTSFTVSLPLVMVFFKGGLMPLYRLQHMFAPDMSKYSNRGTSFPPDFASMVTPVDSDSEDKDYTSSFSLKVWLCDRGHFYSHLRLTAPITTCCECGYTVEWRTQVREEVERVQIHYSTCGFNKTTGTDTQNVPSLFFHAKFYSDEETDAVDGGEALPLQNMDVDRDATDEVA